METLREHYPGQEANIINSDWVVFLTPELIGQLITGKTNKGRYMAFSFLPMTSHGFNTWHSGFTSQYIELCKMCHRLGITKYDENWKVIASAVSGSPLARKELNPNTTQYGNNWKVD